MYCLPGFFLSLSSQECYSLRLWLLECTLPLLVPYSPLSYHLHFVICSLCLDLKKCQWRQQGKGGLTISICSVDEDSIPFLFGLGCRPSHPRKDSGFPPFLSLCDLCFLGKVVKVLNIFGGFVFLFLSLPPFIS